MKWYTIIAFLLVMGAVGCGLSFIGILLRLFPWALLPALLSSVVAFKRVGGWALHELIPLKIAWWMQRRRHQWFRPVPLLDGRGEGIAVYVGDGKLGELGMSDHARTATGWTAPRCRPNHGPAVVPQPSQSAS